MATSEGGDSPGRILCSIVIPVYNEEENIQPLVDRLTRALDTVPACDREILFVLDPCKDRTEERILEARNRDPRIKAVRLSRRFGQPAATQAGLYFSSGDVCVVIDADLQDPPEVIPRLIETWREKGVEVVYAQRRTRQGETLLKRFLAYVGYYVINRIAVVPIPRNVGDFRLLSRRVVNHLLRLKESHGFLRGLVALVGFRQDVVLYDRERRAGGKGHYNRWFGSWKIALNGILGFSNYVLSAIAVLGLATAGLSFLVGLTYVVLSLAGVRIPWGNPTLVILITFLFGVQFTFIGILGEYIGRIYDEVRERPKYIVETLHGFEEEAALVRQFEQRRGPVAGPPGTGA